MSRFDSLSLEAGSSLTDLENEAALFSVLCGGHVGLLWLGPLLSALVPHLVPPAPQFSLLN
jgi:hypothetical protein